MRDAFGVERVSKGVPSGAKSAKTLYAGQRVLANEAGKRGAKARAMGMRSDSRVTGYIARNDARLAISRYLEGKK